MISRRSFTALAGATLFGLFSRIRFAPSGGGPRGRRVRSSRFVAWGDFEFEIIDGKALACEFRGKPMGLVYEGSQNLQYLPFRAIAGNAAAGVDARLRDDGHIGISSVMIKTLGGEASGRAGMFCQNSDNLPKASSEIVAVWEPSHIAQGGWEFGMWRNEYALAWGVSPSTLMAKLG